MCYIPLSRFTGSVECCITNILLSSISHNTPLGAKLGLCRSIIYSKFLIAHKFFHCTPYFSLHAIFFTAHHIFHCTPYFSLHTKHTLLLPNDCSLYIVIAHCTFSLHILYCCSSSCGTLTAEPLLSNSRVASVKQIVIIIVRQVNLPWDI